MERVEEEQSTTMDRKLLISTKRAYALGHIFNDIVAAMWFSYTLIYLQKVALLKPLTAGVLLLLGNQSLAKFPLKIIVCMMIE